MYQSHRLTAVKYTLIFHRRDRGNSMMWRSSPRTLRPGIHMGMPHSRGMGPCTRSLTQEMLPSCKHDGSANRSLLTSPLHRMRSSMQGYSGQVLDHQDPVCPYAGRVQLTNDGPGPSTSARGTSHMGGASVPLVYGRRLHAESSFQREPTENNVQKTVALHQLQA
jgi:hypothetical protein